MSYTIHKSDGTTVTVADNNADISYYTGSLPPAIGRGLVLIGRNYINYGAPIAQNFLQLTENFASTTSYRPSEAISVQGQLWFEKSSATNSATGNLYVRAADSSVSGDAAWKKILLADSSGNIVVDGNITVGSGYSFIGSGSGLTNIPNSSLQHSTITFGSTPVALGDTVTALSGLSSVSASAFNGGGSGLTGIPNTGLVNSKVTLGTTNVSLGQTVTTLNGVTITNGTFSGDGGGLTNIPITAISGGFGSVAVINPTTPKDGDIKVVGSVISIYAASAWRQVFPAVYS